MNTNSLILATTLALPATLSAQSLFHAPLPPQQQQPDQPPQQPAHPAPAQTPTAQQAAPPPAQPHDQNNQAPAAPAHQPPAAALAAPPAARPMLPSGAQVSLFAVQPTKPRKFNKQDKVEIIVNESSIEKFEQKTDSKENADIDASIKALPSIEAMLTDFVLRNTGTPTPKVGLGNGSTYKGQGTYERKDKFVARISAVVTDVKPNGMLVLEARETILSDKESKSMVVSGLCDPKDITAQNTVGSSQLAHLVIKTEHAGDVKDAATKGWLPRVFDAISGN